jgi:hypothetical protein
VLYLIACLFFGFLTPKFALYGGLVALAAKGIAVVTPGFSAPLTQYLFPMLTELAMIFPKSVQMAMTDANGTLGVIIIGLVGAIGFIVYLIGVVSGVLFWPELLLLRIVGGLL